MDIENYDKNYYYAEDINVLVGRLNSICKRLNLIEFNFEQFHYSSTGKTIKDIGYNSLLRFLDTLKESMSINSSSANYKKTDVNQREVKDIFIVHGRNNEAKLELEGIIHRNGFNPIVLDRMTNSGLTIIEKFEKYANVSMVIVLLTPDDVGALVEDGKQVWELPLGFRARQNVIFELGYFYGKLGRSKVCCVVNGGIEIPSDIKGIAYHSYNHSIEEIEHKLVSEMKS